MLSVSSIIKVMKPVVVVVHAIKTHELKLPWQCGEALHAWASHFGMQVHFRYMHVAIILYTWTVAIYISFQLPLVNLVGQLSAKQVFHPKFVEEVRL